jgi:hypothetical protein
LRTSWLIVGNELNLPYPSRGDTNRQFYGCRVADGNLSGAAPVYRMRNGRRRIIPERVVSLRPQPKDPPRRRILRCAQDDIS